MWKKRFAAILLWTLCLTSMLVLAVSTNAQATTAEASGKSAAFTYARGMDSSACDKV